MPEAQVTSLDNTTFVFAPGLITGLLPSLGFQSVWPRLVERFGIKVLAVDAHPMRSGEANTADVLNTLEQGHRHGAGRAWLVHHRRRTTPPRPAM